MAALLNVRFTRQGQEIKGEITFEPQGRRKIVFISGYRTETAATFRGTLPGNGEEWLCEEVRDTQPGEKRGAVIVRPIRKITDEVRWEVRDESGKPRFFRIVAHGAETKETRFVPEGNDSLPADSPAEIASRWSAIRAQVETGRRADTQALIAEIRAAITAASVLNYELRRGEAHVAAKIYWREGNLVRQWWCWSADDLAPAEEVLFRGPVSSMADVRRLLVETETQLVHTQFGYGLWPVGKEKGTWDKPAVEIEFQTAWLAASETAVYKDRRVEESIGGVQVACPLEVYHESRHGARISRAKTNPEVAILAPQLREQMQAMAKIRSFAEHAADYALEQLRAARGQMYALAAFGEVLLGGATLALTTDGLVAMAADGTRIRHLACEPQLRAWLGVPNLAKVDALSVLPGFNLAAFTANEILRQLGQISLVVVEPAYEGPETALYGGFEPPVCPEVKLRRVARLRAEAEAMAVKVREAAEALRAEAVEMAISTEGNAPAIAGRRPQTTMGLMPVAKLVYTGSRDMVELSPFGGRNTTKKGEATRYGAFSFQAVLAEPYDGTGLPYQETGRLPRGTIIVRYVATNGGYATTSVERLGVEGSKVLLRLPWYPAISRYVPQGAYFALPEEMGGREPHPGFAPPESVELTWSDSYASGGANEDRHTVDRDFDGNPRWSSIEHLGGFVKTGSRRGHHEGEGTYVALPDEPILHRRDRKVVAASVSQYERLETLAGMVYDQEGRPFPAFADEAEPVDESWLVPARPEQEVEASLALYYLAPDGQEYVAVGDAKNLGEHSVAADGDLCQHVGYEGMPHGLRWFAVPAGSRRIVGMTFSSSGNSKSTVRFVMPRKPAVAGIYEVVDEQGNLRLATYWMNGAHTPLRPWPVRNAIVALLMPDRTKGISMEHYDEMLRAALATAREWWLDARPEGTGWVRLVKGGDGQVVMDSFTAGPAGMK